MPDRGGELGRRIGRNSLHTLGGEVLGRLLGAAYQVLLARHLGAVVFGEFSFALALTAILGIASDLGLSRLVAREVARRPGDPWPVLSRALAGRAGLALLLGGLGVLLARLSGRPPSVVGLVAILALTQWIQGGAEILAAAHRGRERMLRPAAVGVACRLGLALTGLAAIALDAGVRTFAALTAAWTVPAVALLLRGLPPRPPGRLRLREVALTLERAFPIGLGAVFWTIYFRIDLLLVGWIRGDAEVGLFAAPFRVVEVVLMLQGPVLAAVFPVLARRGRPEESRAAFRGAVRALAVLGFPLGALLLAETRDLLGILFGAEFVPASGAFLLLAATVPASFLAAPFLHLLLSRDRDRAYAAIMGAGAVLNPLLALLLIPRHGYPGAAAATLATELLVMVLAVVHARRTESPPPVLGAVARAFLAAAGAGAGLLLARSWGIAFLPRLAGAMMVLYPALALALGAIRIRDLRVLLSALGIGR